MSHVDCAYSCALLSSRRFSYIVPVHKLYIIIQNHTFVTCAYIRKHLNWRLYNCITIGCNQLPVLTKYKVVRALSLLLLF